MSTPSDTTGVALAVNHPVATGKAGPKGGHVIEWRALCKTGIAPTATVALIPGTGNPWRPGSEGHTFYTSVLAKLPGNATVGSVYTMAKSAMGISAGRVRQHLFWLYSDNGAYMLLDGKRWSASAPVAVATPKAPAKAKAPKAKAPAKVA